MSKITAVVLTLLLTPLITHAMIGYDCFSPSANATAISLHSVLGCKMEQLESQKTTVMVQMLQKQLFSMIPYYQCKVKYVQLIYYCGYYSRTSLFESFYRTRVVEPSREECERMQTVGEYKVRDGMFFSTLHQNGSSVGNFVIYGTANNKAECKGTTFSYEGITYDDAVMTREYSIELRNGYTQIDLTTNQLMLPSKMVCDANKEHCLDVYGGSTFWSMGYLPNACSPTTVDVLYQGKATKLIVTEEGTDSTIIIIESSEITAAFRLNRKDLLCQQHVYLAEHPQIMFVIAPDLSPIWYFIKTSLLELNMDFFRYVNAKFVYLTEMTKLHEFDVYSMMKYDHCLTRKKVLETQLTFAPIDGEQFAYLLTGEPGYHTLLSGEVAYLTKCTPIEVTYRDPKGRCFQELTVEYSINSTSIVPKYMRPRSRSLVDYGTEIMCNPSRPVMYNIDGTWYSTSPHLARGIAPTELDPTISSAYKAITLNNIGTTGIYSQKDLDKMSRSAKWGSEIVGVTNIIALRSVGVDVDSQGIALSNLMTPLDYESFYSYNIHKAWGYFSQIGMIVNGFVGVYFVFRALQIFAGIIINMHMLRHAFGWSFRMVAGVWDKLTDHFLHRHHHDNHELVGHAVLHVEAQQALNPNYAVVV